MPFELSHSLKNTCGGSFASKGMNSLFSSRFYTTALLTVLIIIIIMIIYPVQKKTPIWVLAKLGFYIFLVSLGIIFIHDCIVYHDYAKTTESEESDKFVEGLNKDENIPFNDDKVNVQPNTEGKKKGGDEMVGFGECSGVAGDVDIVGGNGENIFELYGV